MAALFEPKKNNQIANLQKSIEEKDGRIRFLYDEIGKLYFRQYRDMNADVTREINTRCEFITNLYIDIENCRLRILYEKGYKECKNCRKANLLEHAYCCACGAKFPDSNDINIVTSVDPEKFVIMVPNVSQIPMAAPVQTVSQSAPAQSAAPAGQYVANYAAAAAAPAEVLPEGLAPVETPAAVIASTDATGLEQAAPEESEVVIEGTDTSVDVPVVDAASPAPEAGAPEDTGVDPAAD